MNIDIQKAKDFFENARIVVPLNQVKSNSKRKVVPHIILWEGKQIKLSNGKTVWPSLGAAKTALRGKIPQSRLAKEVIINFDKSKVSNSGGYYEYIDGDYKEECYQTTLQELQKAGILKFEPLV